MTRLAPSLANSESKRENMFLIEYFKINFLDIIDEAKPFCECAAILKEQGAKCVVVLCTHAIMSADSPQDIENSQIDKVIVSNTIPHEKKKELSKKVNFIKNILFTKMVEFYPKFRFLSKSHFLPKIWDRLRQNRL